MALTLTRIVVKFIDVAEVEYSDIVKIDTSRSANEQKKQKIHIREGEIVASLRYSVWIV